MADRHEIQEHPMVSVPEALRTVLSVVSAQQYPTANPSENIPLHQALGRTLAEDVVMPSPGYPPYKASIMDGYAISSTDRGASQFRILNKVFAGDGISSNSDAHENTHNSTTLTASTTTTIQTLPTAVYITTGAKVPDQYDVVVPVELCEVSHDEHKQHSILSIDLNQAKVQPNQWIRPAGCDLIPNSTVVSANKTIDYIDIGLLRQASCATVQVYRKTTVGVLSTGNELIKQNWTMEQGLHGAIPDVNRPCLLGLLRDWSDVCTAIDLGTCRDDDPEALVQCMRQAVEQCDVILTTGGISMGESDVMEETLVQKCQGTLHFGRLHMKPGKPTTFVTLPRADGGKKNGVCHVFALPGNPVSAIVCSHLLVKPCLDFLHSMKSASESLSVSNATTHMEIKATLQQTLKLDSERPEYHRVRLEHRHGQFWATSTGMQRSSRLASLQNADGLMVLPQATHEKKQAVEGEAYTVLLLRPLFGVEPSTVATSEHLRRPMQVALRIVDTSGKAESNNDLENLSHSAAVALSGSKTDSVKVTSVRQFTTTNKVWEDAQSISDDVALIVTVPGPGIFNLHSTLAKSLRQSPDFRDSPAIAQQIRQGASTAGDATAAIWETVVGYSKNDRLAILMSTLGLEAGLSHVRGLLKHALQMARGEPHRHN